MNYKITSEDKYGFDIITLENSEQYLPWKLGDEKLHTDRDCLPKWVPQSLSPPPTGAVPWSCPRRRPIPIGNKSGAPPQWGLIQWSEDAGKGDEYLYDKNLNWLPLIGSRRPVSYWVSELPGIKAIRRRLPLTANAYMDAHAAVAAPAPVSETHPDAMYHCHRCRANMKVVQCHKTFDSPQFTVQCSNEACDVELHGGGRATKSEAIATWNMEWFYVTHGVWLANPPPPPPAAAAASGEPPLSTGSVPIVADPDYQCQWCGRPAVFKQDAQLVHRECVEHLKVTGRLEPKVFGAWVTEVTASEVSDLDRDEVFDIQKMNGETSRWTGRSIRSGWRSLASFLKPYPKPAPPPVAENPCCQEWEKNIPLINSAFQMEAIHGGPGYTGTIFKVCPWCGAERPAAKKEASHA